MITWVRFLTIRMLIVLLLEEGWRELPAWQRWPPAGSARRTRRWPAWAEGEMSDGVVA